MRNGLLAALLLTFLTLMANCSPDDEGSMDEQECYRCTYSQAAPVPCDNDYIFEACILRAHESSLQSVIEIIEKCDGQTLNTTERIAFIEDFLAEQQNAGATCEEF